MTIYTIRTTAGREDIVVDLLITKLESEQIDIKSVFHPAEIKGYVFIEGGLGAVHKAMAGLMHSRGLIDKPIQLGEIQHFLEYKKARIRVDDGDIVEIIGGPFKGEKGRVSRINKIKDEITAELLEASIPIPVTIATEFVKVVKKAHPEKAEKEEEVAVEEEGKSVFDKEELERISAQEEAGAAEEKAVQEAQKATADAAARKEKLKFLAEEEERLATEEAKEPAEEPAAQPAEGQEGAGQDEAEPLEEVLEELGEPEKEKKKKKPEEEEEWQS